LSTAAVDSKQYG